MVYMFTEKNLNKINLIVWIWWNINIEFIKKLLNLWIKEFYTWFIPEYWINKYWYDISPNRRYSNIYQLQSFNDLIFLSKFLRKLWTKVFFTLNEHNYSKDWFEFIKNIIEEVNEYVDWYIIANYALLEYLKDKWKEIHISWEMCVLNNYTIDLLVENNVTRIIFPRNISLLEIESITEYRNKNYKNLELELFINDSLLYTCWLCTSFHWEEKYIFCRDEWANLRTLIEYYKNSKEKIFIDSNSEIRNRNCSLCFIKRFIDIWINSFKIPGRTWKENILEKIVELKKYLSDTEYKWKIELKEYNNCKLNNCMYEI